MSYVGSEVQGRVADDRRETGVHDRRMYFCPTLQKNYTLQELVTECDYCGAFHAKCCQHEECHNFKLIFTDGAALSNGQTDAASGLGVAVGSDATGQQWAIPVDDGLDPGQKRTSQRAELLAAIEGLHCMEEMRKEHGGVEEHRGGVRRPAWVITTDSMYVYQGMTEWLPAWKANGLRTSQGRRPSNLDLFLKLEQEIIRLERARRIDVGFWRIPRELNWRADSLAKEAARRAPKASALPSFSMSVAY